MLGTEKLEWCFYQTVKTLENTFNLFDTMHECDRRTDGQIPQDGIGLAMQSTGRQKLCPHLLSQLGSEAEL